MGLMYKILCELGTRSLSYKGMKVNLFGLPAFRDYSKNTMSGALSHMRKKGFLTDDGDQLMITLRGREYVKRKYDSLQQFQCKFRKDAPKNLVLMFDVPETKKAEREWLRWHLKKFNYEMIQKSVWVGPSPLPKGFLIYLNTIGLKSQIKTFKLARDYSRMK
jgi:DNA-binding transcriptional regulator PaaX